MSWAASLEFHVQNVAQAAILMLSSEVRLSAENAQTIDTFWSSKRLE
jgi:hypothetical protein